MALQVSERRCSSSLVAGTGSRSERFMTLMERAAAAISSTGLRAWRLRK